MLESFLMLLHGFFLLIFGISLSAAFAGLRFTKRNIWVFLGLLVFSGALQLSATLIFSEEIVWKLYPLITHLPLILLLRLGYRKSFATAFAATFTAYLFCQPANWLGIIVNQISTNIALEFVVEILCLFFVGYLTILYISSYISEIFSKDVRSVLIFSIVPTVYYIFDYTTGIYTDLRNSGSPTVIEFMPLFLAIIYMAFCLIYYKNHEQIAEAQRKEQIIRISVEQQAKEIATVRQAEQEIRMLRHDMRMLLSSLSVSIENGDTASARKLIDANIARIDATKVERFCSNDIVNYVISDYAARCKEHSIPFNCVIEFEELPVDEIMFLSILSNALDNALNSQKLLSPDKRNIRMMLKKSGGKLLLSVKNPVAHKIVFADGLPVSGKNGHGYGTQSIRFMTERLGGNCQFSVENGTFILRVIL